MERRQGGQAERMKNDSIPPNPHPVKPPPNLPKPRTESLQSENARLKAEVERLKGIILAQSSEFVRNATKQEEEPLHDGWNTGIAKACDLLAEKDKEIERLKAEVERLRKAGDNLERVLTDRSGSYEAGNASHEWNAAKEGKQS